MNKLLVGLPDKTDLLLQLLDFENGVTIIDPTGEFAKAAANILPKRYTEQAVYFDATNHSRPIGLNVLTTTTNPQRLTEQLCACFDALFAEGPATLTRANANYYLANCLRLLLDNDQTLLGVLKLLTDMSFSDTLVCHDPVVQKFWDGVAEWDKKQRATNFAPLLSKIGLLLMSPTIRNIVGQPRTTFSAPIVIANLDRAKLGDTTARLLGGLLIAQSTGPVFIVDYGFFRFPLPLSEERVTVSLNILDEAKEHKQSLLGVEEKYAFTTTKRDAEELASYLGLMNPRKLIDLGPDSVYGPRGEFTPERPPSLKRLKYLKKRTVACHTAPRVQVEGAITKALRGE
jgi:hypothetical protein